MFFNAAGDALALASHAEDGEPWQVEWWDLATRTARSQVTLAERAKARPRFRVSHDRRLLAGITLTPPKLVLWDLVTGRVQQRMALVHDAAWSLASSPDGKRFAVQYPLQRIDLIDAVSGSLTASVPTSVTWTSPFAFTPDGATLVTGGTDNLIQLSDARTGALCSTMAGHGGEITEISVSPDGRTLASSGHDNTLKLWSLATGRELATLTRYSAPRALAFSPDGRLLCSPQWTPIVFTWRAPLDTTNVVAAAIPTNQALANSQ